MKNKIHSMRFKYFRAFILILVIPIISINLITSKIFKDILLRNASYNLNQLVLQVADNLESDIKRASLAASTLYNDNIINDLVNKWGSTQDMNEKFQISKQIDYSLNYLFNFNNEVASVVFFLKDGGAYIYKNTLIIEEIHIRKMDWYQNVKKQPNILAVLNMAPGILNSNSYKNIISIALAPKTFTKNSKIEVIFVAFKSNIPNVYYTNEPFKNKGDILITDEDNKIVMANDKEMINQKLQVNADKLITTAPIQKVNWKVVSLVEYNYITRDVKVINRYLNLMFLSLIFLFIGFSIFYFKDILNPIKKLMDKMGQVEKGDFTTTIILNTNKEISKLGKAFNKMVYEINNLIIEKGKKERERNKAEIEVLQSQINPHFLSNTLNAIRFMAMIAKVDNISHMTEALIKLLNASFGKKGKYIQIKEELDNLKSYVDIMKIRYAGEFDVSFDIEPELEESYILHLLLQPIVENAILHGVCNSETKGYIAVKGRICNKEVIFEIKDIGSGMTLEQIHKALSENCKNEKGFTSMGVGNVNKRIQLNHGEQYGITIQSKIGEYTKVSMRLPLLQNNKEDAVCIEL